MRILRLLVIPILLQLLWTHCANIQTPTGGPKDKRPPQVTASTPRPNQVNFKGKAVLLSFDERVKLNTPREEIIISPSPGETDFLVKGNNVFITPRQAWKDSTTYSILFRDGIQDITESNSPVNLKLAFSTGPAIDSLVIAGNVTNLLQGTALDKMTVAIYTADTFDIFKHAPSYFTKTDKKGNFKLENIRAGRYRIYAFDDVNKNLKVESQSEMYGFLGGNFSLQSNIDTISIGLYRLDSKPLKLSRIRNAGTITRLQFSKSLSGYHIQSNPEVPNAFGDNQSEITIWNPEGADSIRVVFNGADSLDNKIDSAFYVKRTDLKPSPEKFLMSISIPQINPENSKLISTLKFSKPIRAFNMDSLYIRLDTATNIPITKQEVSYNTQFKIMTITKEMDKKLFGPDQDPLISLVIRQGFAISYDGDSSKTSSLPASILWPEENGTMSLQVNTTHKNYIIQVIDKDSDKIVSETVNTPKITARNIPPSEYRIRIIIDRNQNGRWDPGNISKNIEPEKVIYHKTPDGNTIIPIRANWEVGPLTLRF